MNIFFVLFVAMGIMVTLIRKKIPIGPAILAGGLFIWAMLDLKPISLLTALKQTISMPRTYDLIFALFFVICLEIELRKSGILNGLVEYLHHLVPSKKAALMAMPAFLGMLPSVGGARFSAPIIEGICEGQDVSVESKTLVNYWFRHIMEFANPVVPGILLTCAIANIAIGELILHLLWVSVAMLLVGWFFFVRPLKIVEPEDQPTREDIARYRVDFWLALLPIAGVFFLSIYFKLHASISIAIVVALLYPFLRILKRRVTIKDILWGAMDIKLLRDTGLILYFIQILDVSGVLALIVQNCEGAPVSLPVVLGFMSFLIGMLTGMSQGHVAMMMPIVAAVANGSIDLVGLALVFGVGGQMVTPTHVCLMVTLHYFKADFVKTLLPCILADAVLLGVFSAVYALT